MVKGTFQVVLCIGRDEDGTVKIAYSTVKMVSGGDWSKVTYTEGQQSQQTISSSHLQHVCKC